MPKQKASLFFLAAGVPHKLRRSGMPSAHNGRNREMRMSRSPPEGRSPASESRTRDAPIRLRCAP
ncbi:hypothetical protein [Chlorobium limicola]|uniref:hypothetical protein n=1 Tax=Chlorobium limicola TaxID=1092 RepID=UPI00030D33E4|nr:hypothetical protein [Chlorobium limicola]